MSHDPALQLHLFVIMKHQFVTTQVICFPESVETQRHREMSHLLFIAAKETKYDEMCHSKILFVCLIIEWGKYLTACQNKTQLCACLNLGNLILQ